MINRNYQRLLPVFVVVAVIFVLNVPQTLTTSNYIDYNATEIQKAIMWVQANAYTDKDRILKTAEYIEEHVEYEVTGSECYYETAEDVLIRGAGDCVSKTKVAASMLTGMGIPVNIVEGCVFENREAALTRDFEIPIDWVVKNEEGISRTTDSGGQLHSWIRAYDGQNWWTLETTAGVIFAPALEPLFGYNKYGDYVDPNNAIDLCLLTDTEYVEFCATN